MEEMEKSRIGQFEVRTDLALEERESFEGDGGEVSGVSLKEWDRKQTGVKLTEVRILNEQGAKAMGKPMGTYLTLEADRLSKKDDEYHSEISDELGTQLKKLMDQMLKGQERETLSVLVVGLGNPSVTPDSLGPRVLNNLQVTRHLTGEYGEDFLKKRDLPAISGIIPGVMAQTGMETAEILKGIDHCPSPPINPVPAQSSCSILAVVPGIPAPRLAYIPPISRSIFCFCLLRKLRLQQLRDVFQTKRTDIRLFLAAVQAEEVKQGVEHVGHSLGGLQDIVRITAYLFFFVVLHQFRISMYGSQWCA